jgi:hypothetical protein
MRCGAYFDRAAYVGAALVVISRTSTECEGLRRRMDAELRLVGSFDHADNSLECARGADGSSRSERPVVDGLCSNVRRG